MGEAPKGLFHGELLDTTLSDGRECHIYIPHPPDDNGQVDFLGQKMPPGFEWFQPELVIAELRSTTPAWRVRLSRVLATVALVLVILSFWWHDFRWESFGTGVLLSLVAVFLIPSRPKPLPERSEEHTSELQSLMRNSYAVFCL